MTRSLTSTAVQRALCAAAILLAECLAGQAAFLQEMEQSLSQISLLRLKLRCEIVYASLEAKETLFRRWEIGPRALRDRAQLYAIDGERFRFRQDRIPGDELPMDEILRPELAYDGADVQLRTGASVCSVFRRADLRLKWEPDANLFRPYYFDALRISVPRSPETIGTLPTSEVLEAIYADGKVDKVMRGGAPRVRVRETLANGKVRESWLDPARGFAVTDWAETRGGRLVVTHKNSDFVEIGAFHLPRVVESEWYTWVTVPHDISPRPLLKRTIRVTELHGEPREADFRGRALRPGALLVDSRLGGDGGRAVAYRVPVPEAELIRAFEAAAPQLHGDWRWSMACWWTAVHALAVIACWRLARRRHKTPEKPDNGVAPCASTA